jgi:hypothetical protein
MPYEEYYVSWGKAIRATDPELAAKIARTLINLDPRFGHSRFIVTDSHAVSTEVNLAEEE